MHTSSVRRLEKDMIGYEHAYTFLNIFIHIDYNLYRYLSSVTILNLIEKQGKIM